MSDPLAQRPWPPSGYRVIHLPDDETGRYYPEFQATDGTWRALLYDGDPAKRESVHVGSFDTEAEAVRACWQDVQDD